MQPLVVSFDPASARLCREELRRAGARVERDLAPGVCVVVAEPSALDAPIFVRHRFPAEHVVTPALEAIVAAGRDLAAAADPALRLSVQTRVLAPAGFRPLDVNEPVAAASAAPVDVRHPEQVVSIVVASDAAYVGTSTVAFNLSAWAGGERRFARGPGQISRAEFKLLEAVEVFGLRLPEDGVALDLGAAPGGWTRVLRMRGLRVVAVDPAELDPRVAPDPGVRHERVRAQEYLRRAETFDVIVNDMRKDARDSARLTAAFAAQVRPGGVGLITLKLPVQGARRVLTEALRTLRSAYEVTGVRQLFHNRHEVTAALGAS